MSTKTPPAGQDFSRASITAAVVAEAMKHLEQAEIALEGVHTSSLEADKPLIAGMLDHIGSCIEHCADYQGDLAIVEKKEEKEKEGGAHDGK